MRPSGASQRSRRKRGERPETNILHDDVFVTLAARAFRRWSAQYRLAVDFELRYAGAAAAWWRLVLQHCRTRRLRRLLHAGGPERGARRQLLQAADLVLQLLNLAPLLQQRRLQLRRRRSFSLQLRLQGPSLGALLLQFAECSSKQPDQFGQADSFKRISGLGRHTECESHFGLFGTPPPPGNLPQLLRNRAKC
jgi:hypothetical protein